MIVLPFHIAVALISLVFTGFSYFSPSQRKLYISYTLIAATIGSGTWLIVSNPSHLMKSCMYGLVYLCVVFAGIALAKGKLGAESK